MFRKPFRLMISILFSISTLAAFTKPTEIVTLSSPTDTQASATKTPSSDSLMASIAQGRIPMTQDSTGLTPALSQVEASRTATTNNNFGQLPLYFVENRGQTDTRVAYYVLGGTTQVLFADDGVSFILRQPEASKSEVMPTGSLSKDTIPISSRLSPGGYSTDNAPTSRGRATDPGHQWVVKLDFVGANPVQPVGAGKTTAVISYFTGSPDQWQTGLPTYAQIVYRDLWHGIDLTYYGQAGQLKYDFVVHPGADPNQIQLRYRGVDNVSINAIGQMVVNTPLGGFMDKAPVAWQAAKGKRTPVTATYALVADSLAEQDPRFPASRERGGTAEGVTFSFAVGAYDRSELLVIDPAVLIYCGYIGGLGHDEGTGITVDGYGNTYVTGSTWSAQDSFPVTVGPDLTYNSGWDAFVAKVSHSGDALVYAGYIGGALDDYGLDIAVDGAGNAYVTGETWSAQDSFPVIGGPDLSQNGYTDAFVAKVSASGASLVYAGYIGGGVYDSGYGIAVDGSGNAYISGATGSDQTTFPVTGGPDLTFNGVEDAFVAKVNTSGVALVYAGYIGGSGWEWGQSITLDSAGNAYISGTTSSNQDSFPVTVGPDLTFNGNYDVFVAEVSAAGAALIYAGYIGGSGDDKGWGIAVDGSGNAYITGETASTQNSFPVTIGPDLTYNGGEKDAFVAKVSATGAALVYAGYIGGVGGDFGYDIAVDGVDNAYVVGFTSSDQTTFPVTHGPDSTYNGGGNDTFVAKVNASGAALIYAGYIGGSGTDYGIGIAVDGAGNAYVTGTTNSTQDSFPVNGGPDLTYNGGLWDAFVAEVSIVPWIFYLPLALNGN